MGETLNRLAEASQRLSAASGESPNDLCSRLSVDTRLRKATVDTVLWRASATGVIDSHTGRLTGAKIA